MPSADKNKTLLVFNHLHESNMAIVILMVCLVLSYMQLWLELHSVVKFGDSIKIVLPIKRYTFYIVHESEMTATTSLDVCFLNTLHCVLMCLFSVSSAPSRTSPDTSGTLIIIIAGSAAAAIVTIVISVLLCHRSAKNKGNVEELS